MFYKNLQSNRQTEEFYPQTNCADFTAQQGDLLLPCLSLTSKLCSDVFILIDVTYKLLVTEALIYQRLRCSLA